MKELRQHLLPLEREGVIRLTYDENVLSLGDDWATVLERAYGDAQVALLLVSAGYLASPTVEHELSFLMHHRSASRLTIIPVFVGPSGVADREFEFSKPDGAPGWLKLTAIQGIGSPKRTLQEVGRSERERMLADLAQQLRKLAERLGAGSSDRSLGTSPPKPHRIARLRLSNVRSIKNIELDFGQDPRSLTVIVGRNGTCKTTLLRAIAVALAGQLERSALLAHPFGRWITDGHSSAEIEVGLADEPSTRLVELLDIGPEEVEESLRRPRDPVFLCGYGMGRSVAGAEPSSEYRLVDAVGSLFRYESRLAASELTLRRLSDDRRGRKVLDSLKKALGLDHRYRIGLPHGGGIEIEGPGTGGAISFDSWADGYRLTFLWLIDLFGWAMQADAFDDEGDVNGIVLVDEIEQHLHPSMQSGLLGHLRAALPKVQWIVTTHSPIIALAAGHESLVALHRRGDTVVSVQVPSLAGYSAEDVLEDEALFGTDPAGPETREMLDRVHEIQRMAPATRSAGERAELRDLSAELDPVKLPFLRDDPTLARLERIEALLKAAKEK